MKRIFHVPVVPGRMVVWNINNKAILISNSHFHALARELLADQFNEERELSKFLLRITQNAKIGSETESNRLEQILDSRLRAKAENGQANFVYKLTGDDARRSIEDYLEANKFNTGHIFYAIGRLHDGSDDVINISLRRKPNVFQKLRGLLGDAYSEINILRSDIASLEGNSFLFTIQLSSGTSYCFDEDGVRKLSI